MDAPVVRNCIARLLSRQEPALLVPKGPWSPELQRAIGSLAPGKDNPSVAVQAGLHLWNDDLDGCHKIAQDLSDLFGAYLHGIMHRREPDYGNAKYWFRRVGEPPLFPQLREAALDLLGAAPGLDSYRKALHDHPRWDPLRTLDWCEAADVERHASFVRSAHAIDIQGLVQFWLH